MINNKSVLVVAISLLVVGCSSNTPTYDDGFKAGIEYVKNRSENMGMRLFESRPTNMINGVVTQKNAQTLIANVGPLSPFDLPELDTRTVKFDDSTPVMINRRRDESVYRQEMEEYQKQIDQRRKTMMEQRDRNPEAMANPPRAPSSIETVTGSLADIQSGSTITIVGSGDISKELVIQAVQLIVNQ